jgi:lysophospholipase L1-like esterase
MPFDLSLAAVGLLLCSVLLRRRNVIAMQVLLTAWGFGAAGVVSVFSVSSATQVLWGIDAMLLLSIVLPPRWLLLEQVAGLLRRGSVRGATLSLTMVVVMLGATEWAFCLLDLAGIVRVQDPVTVVMTPNASDWRLATILYQERLVDPVLFWRPAPKRPYNEQGFKGPMMSVPKRPDTVRVMCYGDSNTDGPATGNWATLLGPELQELLGNRPVESINAGVSGYSSYQGMRRFEMEVETYEPDMILVSFGWNDAADALGRPDKDYLPPSPAIAEVQRVLYRTRGFRMLMQWLRPAMSPVASSGPRVSVADYAANLRAFAAIARKLGIKLVLMTRPYRDESRPSSGWRATIPHYNTALREVAAQEGVFLIDAQKAAAAHRGLFSDECHFTMLGHRVAAKVLAMALAPLL